MIFFTDDYEILLEIIHDLEVESDISLSSYNAEFGPRGDDLESLIQKRLLLNLEKKVDAEFQGLLILKTLLILFN